MYIHCVLLFASGEHFLHSFQSELILSLRDGVHLLVIKVDAAGESLLAFRCVVLAGNFGHEIGRWTLYFGASCWRN